MGWPSLLPPLLAVLLALWFRDVVAALAVGVFVGALLLAGGNPLQAAAEALDRDVVGAIADRDHATILVFTLLLGGMVRVMVAAGGGTALAERAARRASDARRGQLAAWLLGVLVFFDDYANSLLVGTSLRPVTDRLRISREKLAFLVDATAAPVSSLAIVSTWVGVEVAYIGEQYRALGLPGDPYVVFLQSLGYRFYPWLMLLFTLAVAFTGRDFGPMLRAERRARRGEGLTAPGARPAFDPGVDSAATATPRLAMALLPIAAVVLVAFGSMLWTGYAAVSAKHAEPTLRAIFAATDSVRSLLWGALAGSLSAVLGAVATRALGFASAMETWLDGLRAMLLACVILSLAWALGAQCKALGTADVLVGALGGWLPAGAVPTAVFVVSALVSFATGTSWGTMALLFPLAVPLAHGLGGGDPELTLAAVGAILSGSVWGDHCSPISDTTVLSSLASSCDHVDHVRTQLPYALLVGAVAIVVGQLPVGFGLYPAPVGLLLGAAVLFALLRWRGRSAEPGDGASPVASG